MKHELIQTENYLLIVDDLEIRIGDYRYNIQRGYVVLVDDEPTYYNRRSDMFKKIIAHLPISGAPVLEGVDLLPPIEDEAEKLTKQEFDRPLIVDMGTDITPSHQQGFVVGYNKAKEKYKYTEEDILIIRNKLVSMLPTGDVSAWDMIMAASNYTKWFDEYIQSLQQPKMPVGFECETKRIYPNPQTISKEYDFDDILIERKTTTNSQGQTVWGGKYIFND